MMPKTGDWSLARRFVLETQFQAHMLQLPRPFRRRIGLTRSLEYIMLADR